MSWEAVPGWAIDMLAAAAVVFVAAAVALLGFRPLVLPQPPLRHRPPAGPVP